jgi:hypothetical protein
MERSAILGRRSNQKHPPCKGGKSLNLNRIDIHAIALSGIPESLFRL